MKRKLFDRRDFLKTSGLAALGCALAACGVDPTTLPDPTSTPPLTLVPTLTKTQTTTPTPTSTNTPTLTPTPKPPTLGELARKLGFDIGISLAIDHSIFQSPEYQKFALNFSMLTDGAAANPGWTDSKVEGEILKTSNYWSALSEFCKSHNLRLDHNHLFWGFGYFYDKSPIYYLMNASKEELDAYMQKRVEMFFKLPYFTSTNFVNEVIPHDPSKLDEYGWGKTRNPFYKIYGENYPYVCYKVSWNEAVKTGRTVGKDIDLVYNSASMEAKSPGADFELNYVKKLRDKVRKDFKIDRPFDIGMQFHITATERSWLWNSKKFTYTTLVNYLKELAQVGDIRITEFSISNTDDEQEQKDIIHTIMEAFVDSKVGKSFMMGDPVGSAFKTNVDVMPNLVDTSYKPKFMFDEIYKILQSKL